MTFSGEKPFELAIVKPILIRFVFADKILLASLLFWCGKHAEITWNFGTMSSFPHSQAAASQLMKTKPTDEDKHA